MDNDPNPFFFYLTIFFILLFFVITLIKKRKQLGRTWNPKEATQVFIKEKQVVCPHCGHDRFSKREGLLITTWITFFFRTQYWNRSARCFLCAHCGYLHWFVTNEKEKTS